MHRLRQWIGLTIAITSALLGIALISVGIGTPDAAAQAPSESACRGCHGDNQRTLTLPSGEELPLLVHLTEFDVSAHGSASDQACNTCHTGANQYRYPHEPLPSGIHTLQDYAEASAATCESCHYAHEPFHADLPTDALAPTCTDCHGGHDIAPFEQMVETMPDKCLTCHTDESVDWVRDFFAPRPGFGDGVEGYAGSARCLGCHEELYLGWQETHHALSIQNATLNPEVVIGDFLIDDPQRPFSLTDVAYTIGGIRQQKYITHTAEGGFFVLPGQWNMATEEWAEYHGAGDPMADWRETCAGCHVTGLDTATWEFNEFGIGCESCHGPGLEHSQAPEEVKPFAEVDDQVCGACHSRGVSPAGLPYPATYAPGDTLTDHFTFTTDPEHFWPDGSARTHNQQYMDWQLGGPMAVDESTSCMSCHTVHAPGDGPAQLNEPLNETCLQCHNDKRSIIEHMPYHEVASTTNDFTCADCHMPKLATSATPFDSRSHAFFQPDPQASIDHGGTNVMPNACNQCHTGYGEDPEWAVEIINYTQAQQQQISNVFGGPGETPTPPLPPTPLPSVGEPVEGLDDDPGRGIRIALWAFGVIFAVVAIVVIVAASRDYIRTRSARNV